MKNPQTRIQTITKIQDLDTLLYYLKIAASNLSIAAPNVGKSKGKAYEAWLMLEIANKLKKENFRLIAHGCDDQPVKILKISGSPANMPSKNSKANDSPCHFKFYRNKQEIFELHLGLNVLGSSSATHEVDLAILESKQALALRINGGGPFEGNLVAALELKAFDKEGKLPHDISRAFLGVVVDVGHCWFFKSNGLINYASIVTSADIYKSSKALLHHHSLLSHTRVDPNETTNLKNFITEIFNTITHYRI